jgi:hypothetical protein
VETESGLNHRPNGLGAGRSKFLLGRKLLQDLRQFAFVSNTRSLGLFIDHFVMRAQLLREKLVQFRQNLLRSFFL